MMDGPQNEYQAFAEAVDISLKQHNDNQCILIHCSAGSSRSPSVAAAAISDLTDKSLSDALNQVMRKRPETDPRKALVRQAINFTDGAPEWRRRQLTHVYSSHN